MYVVWREETCVAYPGGSPDDRSQAIVLTGLAAGLALALSLVGHVHTYLTTFTHTPT